ncbi:MAG: hypothetical protein IJH76_02695 [Clostridia bacterium]|nr:hypothetical protein [Clostridia bacterium]
MNVTIPENRIDKKAKIVYATIIGICVISIILVIYLQFVDGRIVSTVGNLKGKSELNYDELKSEFTLLFDNAFPIEDEKYSNIKEEPSKKLIYTSYTNNEVKDDIYSLNVSVPYINIKSKIAKKYNEEIENYYKNKAEEILKSTSKKRTLFTVKYACDIQDDVLSLVIYESLVDGNNPQKVSIKTYNYNLNSDKEVDLSYVLNMENVDKSYVQDRINKEIEIAHKNAEDLKNLGKIIYERDLKDNIYKVENVKDFFFHNGSIYIIFAYGNDTYTTEMDLVVI